MKIKLRLTELGSKTLYSIWIDRVQDCASYILASPFWIQNGVGGNTLIFKVELCEMMRRAHPNELTDRLSKTFIEHTFNLDIQKAKEIALECSTCGKTHWGGEDAEE